MTLERHTTQPQEQGPAIRPEVQEALIQEAIQDSDVNASVDGIKQEGNVLIEQAKTPEAQLTVAIHTAEHAAAAGEGNPGAARDEMVAAMQKRGLPTDSLTA